MENHFAECHNIPDDEKGTALCCGNFSHPIYNVSKASVPSMRLCLAYDEAARSIVFVSLRFSAILYVASIISLKRQRWKSRLAVASGTLAELETQVELARRFGYIDDEKLESTIALSQEVDKMIWALARNIVVK